MLDFLTANLIQRALERDGVARQWLGLLSDPQRQALEANGLRCVGTTPRFDSDAEPFWQEWAVADRDKAQAALEPFRHPLAPIEFSLEPLPGTEQYSQYHCPGCSGAHLHIEDGDIVSVPVLPAGVPDYGHIDPMMVVGDCDACGTVAYAYEFGFSSVSNPDGNEGLSVLGLIQIPDRIERYRATADGMEPWLVTRMFFDTGRLPEDEFYARTALPKGPFVVDYHQIGPRTVVPASPGGIVGIEHCDAGPGSAWAKGAELFHNLAAAAMAKVMAAACRG